MTKEIFRMQMLDGIITEGQYKAKLEEEDSMGKVGAQYAAPGYEDEVKGNKTKIKKALERKSWEEKFKKIVFDLYNDASQGLIFVSDNGVSKHPQAVYVDEKGKYKYLLTPEYNKYHDSNFGLSRIGNIYSEVLPKSEAIASPYKLDIDTFHPIIRAVLQPGPEDYHVNFFPDGTYKKDRFGGGGGNMIQIGYTGYVVETSKFSREDNPNFGFPQEIGNGMSWVPFTFRN